MPPTSNYQYLRLVHNLIAHHPLFLRPTKSRINFQELQVPTKDQTDKIDLPASDLHGATDRLEYHHQSKVTTEEIHLEHRTTVHRFIRTCD